MRKIAITEEQINKIVKNTVLDYLYEGRKVLKLGGKSQPNGMEMPPQPQAMPPMDSSMGGYPNGGMMPPIGGGNSDAMGGAPDDGNIPPMGDDGATAGQSEFDTNFDAGVEADEDADPKKYIQQLTGKLSQSLSKYNNENGMDNGLCKYVANMIVKQAAKGLDEKDRKDIIKAINTTQEDNSDEMGDDEEMPDDTQEGNEMPMDDEMGDMQQPMQECCYSKRQIRKIFEEINPSQEERQDDSIAIRHYNNNTPFRGKVFR